MSQNDGDNEQYPIPRATVSFNDDAHHEFRELVAQTINSSAFMNLRSVPGSNEFVIEEVEGPYGWVTGPDEEYPVEGDQ